MRSFKDAPVMLTSDVDFTLLAGDWHPEDQPHANRELDVLTSKITTRKQMTGLPRFYVGDSTGRTLRSHREELEDLPENDAFRRYVGTLDAKTGSVGAEIEWRQEETGLFVPMEGWPGNLAAWDRGEAYRLLRERRDRGELVLQPKMAQSAVKLSFDVFSLPLSLHEGYADEIAGALKLGGIEATVIFSGGRFLDILPQMANGLPINKGTAQEQVARFFAERDSLPELPICIFAGDSENDEDGFAYAVESGGFGIIPANAKAPFKRAMRKLYPGNELYIARTARFAGAIYRGLRARGVRGF